MTEQTIPSDAPSEYMRGYSDGVEWARQQEREECASISECYDLGTAEGHEIARAIRERAGHEIPR